MRELFAKHRARILFLTRYALSAVIGSVVQILFLYIWVSVLRLTAWYLVGLALGFTLALIVTFVLQKWWSFRDHERSTAPAQLLSYTVVAVSGLLLNALLLAGAKVVSESLGLDFFRGWYLLAQVVSTGVVAFSNLCLNFIFTFRGARRKQLWNQ